MTQIIHGYRLPTRLEGGRKIILLSEDIIELGRTYPLDLAPREEIHPKTTAFIRSEEGDLILTEIGSEVKRLASNTRFQFQDTREWTIRGRDTRILEEGTSVQSQSHDIRPVIENRSNVPVQTLRSDERRCLPSRGIAWIGVVDVLGTGLGYKDVSVHTNWSGDMGSGEICVHNLGSRVRIIDQPSFDAV
jgi:hypothetical protein